VAPVSVSLAASRTLRVGKRLGIRGAGLSTRISFIQLPERVREYVVAGTLEASLIDG